MSFFRGIFAFPLFQRELTERAARRRTYFIRVAFGATLYGIFLLIVQRATAQAASDATGLATLGFGNELLRTLVQLLCWSLLLIQPAMMAGVLTYEKERDSFPLLQLTGMSPTRMLLEKYVAGLFPMATLLLLALPIAAITMGYGGVSTALLSAVGVILLASWLAIGAWSLFCSAWCRSTWGAVLMAYLGGASLILAPPLYYSVTVRYVLFGADLTGVDLPSWVWGAWPPEIFSRVLEFQRTGFFPGSGPGGWSPVTVEAARLCIPLGAAAVGFLLLARIFLLRRMAPSPGLRVTSWQRLLDFISRGRALMRPAHPDLPIDDPIAWRESGRSLLGRRGRFYYLTVLLTLGVLAFTIFLLGLYPRTAGPQRVNNLAMILGGTAVLVLAVRSVNALLSEQANQTLDILFTTPMGADQIMREKARALGRYWFLFACMLGVVLCLQGWSENQYVRSGTYWQEVGQYWSVAALALLIYPPLIIWLSLLAAACIRRRMRAMFTVLLILGTWFLLPMILLPLMDPAWREKPALLWASLLSPLGILSANEQGMLPYFSQVLTRSGNLLTVSGQPLPPVVVNFAGYALLTGFFRWVCLRFAYGLLRR